MKTLKIHVFFIVLSVFGHQLYAQDIILPLKRVLGSEPNIYSYSADLIEDVPTLLGIPDTMKNYKILAFDFHKAQSVFEHFKDRKMTETDSLFFRKIDTKTLSLKKTKHITYFLSCFNADSSARTVIIDANMNYDFSDDIPIFLEKSSGNAICMINYEYYDKQIYQMNVILRLRPLPILFQTLAEEDNDYDAKHSLSIDIFEHRQATFLFEGKTYNFSIASGAHEFGRFKKYDLSVRTQGNSTYLNEKAYKEGSIIPVGNAFFSTSVDIKGENLILKKVQK